jgi:hypothetical protein
MNKGVFINAVIKPNAALDALMEEPSLEGDIMPGLTWLAVTVLGLGLGSYLAAWLLSGLDPEGQGGMLANLVSGWAREYTRSPLLALAHVAQDLAVQLAAGLVFVVGFDYMVRRWWVPGSKSWVRCFNLSMAMTLPLSILLVIPLLGPLAFSVLSLLNLWRIASRLYKLSPWPRALGAGLLASLPALGVAWAMLGLTGFALGPLGL